MPFPPTSRRKSLDESLPPPAKPPVAVAPSPFKPKPSAGVQEAPGAPISPPATTEPTEPVEPAVGAPEAPAPKPTNAPVGGRYGLSPDEHSAASDYVRAVARAHLDDPAGTSTGRLTSAMDDARKEWEAAHPSPEEIPETSIEGHRAPSEEEAAQLLESVTPENLALIANRLSLLPGDRLRKLKEQLGPLSPEAQRLLDLASGEEAPAAPEKLPAPRQEMPDQPEEEISTAEAVGDWQPVEFSRVEGASMGERLDSFTQGDKALQYILTAPASDDYARMKGEYGGRFDNYLKVLAGARSDAELDAAKAEWHDWLRQFDAAEDAASANNTTARQNLLRALAAGSGREYYFDYGPVNESYTVTEHFGQAVRLLGTILHRPAGADPFLSKFYVGDVHKYYPDGRPRWSDAEDRIAVGKDTEYPVCAHELAHMIEDRVPGVKFACREFLKHRVGDEPFSSLKKLFPEHNYSEDEKGRKDRFDRYFKGSSAYYCGKDYPVTGSTEILSMGVEALFREPADFCKKDPEYAKFVIGILTGALRHSPEEHEAKEKEYKREQDAPRRRDYAEKIIADYNRQLKEMAEEREYEWRDEHREYSKAVRRRETSLPYREWQARRKKSRQYRALFLRGQIDKVKDWVETGEWK